MRRIASLIAWLDELFPGTKGRICTLAGQRYSPLVVIKTTAWLVPCQQTRKSGQMFPYNRERLWGYLEGKLGAHNIFVKYGTSVHGLKSMFHHEPVVLGEDTTISPAGVLITQDCWIVRALAR